MHRFLALAAPILIACSTTPTVEGQKASPLGPTLTLAASEAGLARGGEKNLDFTRLRDLHVRATLAKVPNPPGVLTLTIRGRDGEISYTDARIGAQAPAAQETADVAGFDRPLPIVPVRAEGAAFIIDRVIPIAGTPLSRFVEPGQGSVEVDVAGEYEMSADMIIEASSPLM